MSRYKPSNCKLRDRKNTVPVPECKKNAFWTNGKTFFLKKKNLQIEVDSNINKI